MSDANPLGALRQSAVQDFRRRAMGVLVQEMVLDCEKVVEAHLLGVFDLCEHLLIGIVFAALVPRARNLNLVKDAELHARIPASLKRRVPAALSATCPAMRRCDRCCAAAP